MSGGPRTRHRPISIAVRIDLEPHLAVERLAVMRDRRVGAAFRIDQPPAALCRDIPVSHGLEAQAVRPCAGLGALLRLQ